LCVCSIIHGSVKLFCSKLEDLMWTCEENWINLYMYILYMYIFCVLVDEYTL
jgi:hypothetical protein